MISGLLRASRGSFWSKLSRRRSKKKVVRSTLLCFHHMRKSEVHTICMILRFLWLHWRTFHWLQGKRGIVILEGHESSMGVVSKAKMANKTFGRKVKMSISRGQKIKNSEFFRNFWKLNLWWFLAFSGPPEGHPEANFRADTQRKKWCEALSSVSSALGASHEEIGGLHKIWDLMVSLASLKDFS